MIDLILIVFSVAMFCGGFYCGHKYQTYGALRDAFFDLFK